MRMPRGTILALLLSVMGLSDALAQATYFSNDVAHAPPATLPFPVTSKIPVIQPVGLGFKMFSWTPSGGGGTMLDDAANAILPAARTNLGLGTIAVLAAPAGGVVGTTDSQILTNKTIDCASNNCTVRIANDVTGLAAGMAAFITTPSSSNLAATLTDKTGSGVAVFAINPTLTAPNLGTPSALVLTNATALPISTGVSGLGTSVATFLGVPSAANFASMLSSPPFTPAVLGGSPASHGVPVDVAGVSTYKVIPDCPDTSGNHINYTQSSDVFSCGTTNAVKSKIVNLTYDLTTASGNLSVTGFGFRPTSCVGFGGGTNSTGYTTYNSAVDNALTQSALYQGGGGTQTFVVGAFFVFIDITGANTQTGLVTSLDADGLTINWTKVNSPTGTVGISITCRREG